MIDKDSNVLKDCDEKERKTPAIWAIAHRHLGILKLIIEKNPECISKKVTQYGYTPTLWAAKIGRTDALKLMIEKNPNVLNHKSPLGETLASIAEKNGRAETLELIMKNTPAVLLDKDKDDYTPTITKDQVVNTATITKDLEDRTSAITKDQADNTATIQAEKTPQTNTQLDTPIFSKESWPINKQILLSKFSDKKDQHDFEKALDHLARHARVLNSKMHTT